MKKVLPVYILVLIVVVAASCKKNKNGTEEQDTTGYDMARCKLTRIDIHGSNPSLFYRTLQYGGDGKLATVTTIVTTEVSSTTTFQYAPKPDHHKGA